MLVSSPLDFSVLRPFLEEVLSSVMPPVQSQTEPFLGGSCQSTCQFKQLPGRRQFRIVGEVSVYYHHLVELTYLHGEWPKGLRKSTQAVTDYAVNNVSLSTKSFPSRLSVNCLSFSGLRSSSLPGLSVHCTISALSLMTRCSFSP